jgi:antitoxin HigA-1
MVMLMKLLLKIIIKEVNKMAKLENIHPGEILLEEFLRPLDISQNKLARDIDVPPRRINEIVHGLRAVTADTDLRLSKALGTSEGFWLGLQSDYDLEERKKKINKKLRTIKLISQNAA